jgi:hypothetical protein
MQSNQFYLSKSTRSLEIGGMAPLISFSLKFSPKKKQSYLVAFSHLPADLDWAHTWQVLERLPDFQMCWWIWTLLTWRVLRVVGGFSNSPVVFNGA